MRLFAATALVAMAACGVAFAQTGTKAKAPVAKPAVVAQPTGPVTTADPTKTFTFDKPAKWPPMDDVTPKDATTFKGYVSGNANEECYFTMIQRPETVSSLASDVARNMATPIAPDKWVEALSTHLLLQGGTTTVASTAVDTSKPFPVQTAVLDGKNHVIASISARPGFEVWTLCTAYDGKDHTAQFQGVAGSIASPKDAEWIAQIEAAKAAAAAPPPPAPTEKGKGKSKN